MGLFFPSRFLNKIPLNADAKRHFRFTVQECSIQKMLPSKGFLTHICSPPNAAGHSLPCVNRIELHPYAAILMGVDTLVRF